MAVNKNNDFKKFPSEEITTEPFPCLWAKVDEPETKYDTDGVYSINLVIDETSRGKFEEISNKLLEETKKIIKPKYRKQPPQAIGYIIEYDDDSGEETGNIILKPKKKAKTAKGKERKVPVYDTKGNRLLPVPDIWNGSVVSVSFDFVGYETASNWGITARLKAVQIFKLKAGDNADASAYGFCKDGEGYVQETPINNTQTNDFDGNSDDSSNEDEDSEDF